MKFHAGIDQPALSRMENGHTPKPTLDKRLILREEVPETRARRPDVGPGGAKKMAARKKRTA